MFKSVFASFVVLASFVLTACGSNADSGEDLNTPCPSAGTGCKAEAQGQTCGSNVCCNSAWLVGTSCATATPAPSATTTVTPAPTASTNPPVNDGGVVQNPGPSPTQPPVDGVNSWCGSKYRTVRITWAGIPANGFTTRRGAWASPVIKGATGVKSDFRAWPSQTPAANLDTWLEMNQNVTYSTASFVEDVKICEIHSLMMSLYDNHTDGRATYAPAANCDATATFTENGVQVTPRCVRNNTNDGWNYIVN